MLYLILYLAVAIIIQILLFVPAFIFKTDKLTDLSYSLSFIILSLVAFLSVDFNWFKLVAVLMIIIWGLRLGIYLIIRIWKIKRDRRFDTIRNKFFKFLTFWLGQGLSVWVICLAALIFLNQPQIRFNYLMLPGFLVWLLGLVIESIADWQKFKFIRNKNNYGRWVETGIWKYSRHPNYFGEILIWLGIYLFVISNLNLNQGLIALISPLFIIILLLFITGIPKLEKYANKKWGDNPEYVRYKKFTSILIPWFRK